MQEKWIHWKPDQGLDSKYYIDFVSDTKDGFKIGLSVQKGSSEKCSMFFPDSVYSYRSVDELLMTSMLQKLTEQYGEPFIHDWSFFKVENSNYLQWLSEQSGGLADYRNLIHFSIISVDSILDIISNYEPKVLK